MNENNTDKIKFKTEIYYFLTGAGTLKKGKK